MEYDFKDDRLYIMRTVDEKKGDEIQQASAITAAVREVALMLIAQQLEVGVVSQLEPVEKLLWRK